MGLDLKADKPKVNAELRVMMAKLWLKSNWTKIKTIPRDISIPANRHESFHVNEN